ANMLVPLGSDALPGGITSGTVLVYRGDSTWFIANAGGSVYRNGAVVATASPSLQFILSSVLFTAGLPQPSAPTLYLKPGSTDNAAAPTAARSPRCAPRPVRSPTPRSPRTAFPPAAARS